MAHIFVSYSRKDSRKVNDLVQKIEDLGYKVWRDTDEIKGGDSWAEEVGKAIQYCDKYVVALSSSSINSESVKRELALACEERKPIIPIILNRLSIPPEIKVFLGARNRIDFRKASGIDELIDALGGVKQGSKVAQEMWKAREKRRKQEEVRKDQDKRRKQKEKHLARTKSASDPILSDDDWNRLRVGFIMLGSILATYFFGSCN